MARLQFDSGGEYSEVLDCCFTSLTLITIRETSYEAQQSGTPAIA